MGRSKRSIGSIAALILILAAARPASAGLGDLLKKGALILGGGALVKAIAGPIDDFINKITFNTGAELEGHTKVVPIVSIGEGTHIGAAQVGGTSGASVERVQAVAQLEASFHGVRARILIPIDTVDPTKRFQRVQGVGVTAIIDVDI